MMSDERQSMNPTTNRRRGAALAVLLTGVAAPARADIPASVVAVPEPSSLVLLGGALAGGALLLAWIRRRRR